MLFGVYTAAHGSTCQGRPGSYLYEAVDSRSYCDAGVDYLKIDQCGGDSYERHGLPKNTSWVRFQEGFAECLASTGRPIVQSVESCGTVAGCGEWIAQCSNLWRTGADLEATWQSIMNNLDVTAKLYSLAGPSHWNDPDMLQVGNVGITSEESRSHFALWCFLAAPLLIGTDIHQASDETIAILGSAELIAIDQDPLGFQGRVVAQVEARAPTHAGRNPTTVIAHQVYGKKLADGSVGALVLNRGDTAVDVTVSFQDVWWPAGASAVVRDLWAERDLGTFTGQYTAKAVPSHGTVALRLKVAA
jgi:alpha-galactosidase